MTAALEENNMPWNYDYNPTLEIIEVVYAGRITERDLHESASELIALEKEKGLNQFLIFITDDMEYAGSLTVVHDMPAKKYLEAGADRSGRVALVLPTSPENRKVVQFYETVCKNRGWFVEAFSVPREAICWLVCTSSSNKPDADSRA